MSFLKRVNLTRMIQQTTIIHVQTNEVIRNFTNPFCPSFNDTKLMSSPCYPNNRSALKISKEIDILDHIHSLPEPAQSEAQSVIRAIESAAMVDQEPQPGLVELIEHLRKRNLQLGICTRNFDGPVAHLLDTFLPPGKIFDPVITRDFKPPKPHPAGILHIATRWGLEDGGESLIMVRSLYSVRVIIANICRLWGFCNFTFRVMVELILRDMEELNLLILICNQTVLPYTGSRLTEEKVGDSIDDMVAGSRAGAATVLLANESNAELKQHECTGTWIERLDDLIGLVDDGFEERV